MIHSAHQHHRTRPIHLDRSACLPAFPSFPGTGIIASAKPPQHTQHSDGRSQKISITCLSQVQSPVQYPAKKKAAISYLRSLARNMHKCSTRYVCKSALGGRLLSMYICTGVVGCYDKASSSAVSSHPCSLCVCVCAVFSRRRGEKCARVV
jgi:hypothetical protein